MEFRYTNLYYICIIALTLISPVFNAPKYRPKSSDSIKVNEKQSGDNNVRINLKNFHILAVLGDYAWGTLGDYDYSYDYSDMTIKPTLPLTTINPQQESTKPELDASSTTSKSEEITASSTLKPQSTTKSDKNINETQTDSSVTKISIKPVKHAVETTNERHPSGETMHYRKCTEGYTKDKQGRCRKIVRIPSGISSLASNIVAKIRQAVSREETM